MGKNVVAKTTEDVGYRGAVLTAVILVGGTGCIGAYFMVPICAVYATPKSPATAATLLPAPAAAMRFFVAGGVVVVIGAIGGLKLPVIEAKVNLGE